MNLLYPKIAARHWLPMLRLALLGALIAGAYGILHDQITYSISPEYFTKLKFEQFHYANFGLPQRIYVAEIGFLATWWVGLVAGWFLARLTIPTWPIAKAFRYTLISFSVIFGFAITVGAIGGILGYARRSDPDFTSWSEYSIVNHVEDLPAFVQVAYIHNASYLGGLIGLLAALAVLLWKKRQVPADS